VEDGNSYRYLVVGMYLHSFGELLILNLGEPFPTIAL
jgi:hypothetical protein